MSATNAIKQRLSDLGITQIELAEKLGITRQNLNNKLSRDNFTAKELERICKILDLKVIAISKDGKKYAIEYDKPLS